MSDEGYSLARPRHRVSPRAVTWWTLQGVLTALGVLVPLAVVLASVPPARGLLVSLLPAAVALGVAYVLVMPRWRFRVHRWEVTGDAVYIQSGWLNQEWRIAPMSRIQTVDTARGPLQQLLGLSTVTVTTASAAGPLQIDGLDEQPAAELAQQLTATAQATPDDAT